MKIIGKITLCGSGNSRCENIINTVVYEDIFVHFTKISENDVKKHYVSHCFLSDFRHVADHHFSSEENAIRRSAQMRTPNPYKHCRL